VRTALLVVAGAAVSAAAFPPWGPGLLVLAGVGLFLAALRVETIPHRGFWAGFAYGTLLIGFHMWWLARLHPAALGLAPVQGFFFGAFGWWLVRRQEERPLVWWGLATCGWAVMELVRYRVPYGGMEWGAAGYALADNVATRAPAAVIGTSGLTVLVVAFAGLLAVAVVGRRVFWRWMAGVLGVFAIAAGVAVASGGTDVDPVRVAIVQGSTPCPFEHCPPNERFRTFEQHLALTRTIEPGSVDLVVWPESSLGSTNADPVMNPDVGEAMTGEAQRIGAWLLAGSDRPLDDANWVNANVLISPHGEIVGEYRKQLPVPFGEFIPFRPLFTRLISELSRVPRDMIPGDGPVVFDLGSLRLGSVISWEGGFSRYARQHASEGAQLMVVATNNDSYGPDAPTSDIFMGMTRMRATELGLDLIHAAVSGKSGIVDSRGFFISPIAANGEQRVIAAQVFPRSPSLYARVGDMLMWLAAIGAPVLWWWTRRLVGSRDPGSSEEE
jgi:apolipoprotein N-acyltransferase